jgi:pimeloyl-ACP methyl ester carboxylesterase
VSASPPGGERSQIARPDATGTPTFDWMLTNSSITDIVKLVTGPFDVLPVVFIPGIMGSNLRVKGGGQPIWRLDLGLWDMPWNLVRGFATKGPGPRQKLLHPTRCEVDPGGAVPDEPAGTVYYEQTYRDRGWGTVAEGSYHEFLLWLETTLNPTNRNPVFWPEYYQAQQTISAPLKPGDQPRMFPGIRMGMNAQPFGAEKQPFAPVMSDDLIAQSKFLFPVYAVGYNWLASNDDAAVALKRRIAAIIAQNNNGQFRCTQVIVVTHSMGGLVARACAQLPGMTARIAGIVHGVMPAVGAAVAYRRCKVGMRDEDFGAGLVIGSNGREVTAVFAPAPFARLFAQLVACAGCERRDGAKPASRCGQRSLHRHLLAA